MHGGPICQREEGGTETGGGERAAIAAVTRGGDAQPPCTGHELVGISIGALGWINVLCFDGRRNWKRNKLVCSFSLFFVHRHVTSLLVSIIKWLDIDTGNNGCTWIIGFF